MATTNSQAPQLFSGGIEMASLMLSTGILQKGWDSISELQHLPIHTSMKTLPKAIIFTFNSTCRHQPQGSESILRKLDTEHPLSFLITKDNKDISLCQSSLSTFDSLLQNESLKQQLTKLTSKNQPQLILVGQSLGGSLAALFTLWLLKNRLSAALPICITYGSPLIGDMGLQKAINKIDQWKAQFWHIVDTSDCIPRRLARTQLGPFGTYFLCSESGCTCISDPQSVRRVLELTSGNMGGLDPNQETLKDYGAILQQLKQKMKFRSNNQPTNSSILQLGLAMQLEAVGVGSTHPQHRDLLGAMEEREKVEFDRKKSAPNPSKRLNEVKKHMVMLEWYMKWCEKKNTMYYERFKSSRTEKDIDVIKFKNILANYWKEMVEKSESEPQTPDVPMRDRWLFSGTNYRRIAEPLDIAEYYKEPENRDYINKKRSQHYKVLEAWQREADRPKIKDKAPSLTEDSCFWAKVEEARIKLEELKKPDANQDELRKDLKDFEHYVIELIHNRELSRMVFTTPNNLFLTWWEGYKEFSGQDYNSSLGFVIDDPSQYQ